MFNPVNHHCHPFTDFYKGLICVEPKPLLTARKSDALILWRACLRQLVVPVGFDPRTYSIRTLHDDQNWEIRNISIDHTKHGKYNIDIIRKPNQKIFGQRIYQDRQKNNPTYHN